MTSGPPADQAPTLVLAPLDQGVRNVGGRPGTAQGPARLLDALEDGDHLPGRTAIQDLDLANDPERLEADLETLSQAVASVLDDGGFPLVLGGDHGTTYATVRGAARVLDRPSVTYLDVHLDLRPSQPVHTSGSSFRRLVEEAHVAAEDVHPIGIVRPETPEASERSGFDGLAAWAEQAGITWTSLEEARARGVGRAVEEAMAGSAEPCFSFDADCLSETLAPGVSAPGPDRFDLEDGLEAVSAAAEACRVFDVVEYAPRLDEGERTLESLTEVLSAFIAARWPA